MKSDKLDDRMRRLEYFHSLVVLPGLYSIVRVDGRSFTKLTRGMEHPFDEAFHLCMVATAKALLIELGGLYAFTESDEISILLPRNTDLFGREGCLSVLPQLLVLLDASKVWIRSQASN